MRSTFISIVKGFRGQQWLVVALFLLVAGFTTFKVVQTIRAAIFWQAHRDEPIRGWMNVGYVAWVILGLIVVVILGWKIVQYLCAQNSLETEQTVPLPDTVSGG